MPARVAPAVCRHPDVRHVELVGSRARGDPTALSDWDFHIHTANAAVLAADLPGLAASLEPLAAQWDRLTERATYMLVLPGAIKVDLFPGEERRQLVPPWEPTPGNLADIDAHFWDWTLWLGSKVLAVKTETVVEELTKLRGHLLGPMGVTSPPATVGEAVADYRIARERLERTWRVTVPRRLGDEVTAALVRHGVV